MQKIRAFGAGSAFVFCLMASPGASAAGIDTMQIGASTTAPIGHHLFCLDRPEECKPSTDRSMVEAPLVLDPELIGKVAAINTRTNAEIEPASDLSLFGVEERWAYPADRRGDCEDFVLLKRQRLNEIGISLSHLLITVVHKKNGEGHAILTLRTTAGDFVLDNLDWRVRPWRDTSYRYIKRQSETDPGRWFAITEERDVAVGAVGG